MKTLLTSVILIASTIAANAQGYARYPSQYGPPGHTYRAPYYGGGLRQTCGYYGCYAQRQQAYRPPTSYQWYGGNSRAYLGGRGGGWGGEW